jgi:hypothetical protein
VQFDQMCAEVDEFEPLPALSSGALEPDDSEEEMEFNGQILAGLVSPV